MEKRKTKEKRIDNYMLSLALEDTISELNSLDVLIFYLRINRNLTLKEISNKLAISHECVRKHLQTIFSIVRENIKK